MVVRLLAGGGLVDGGCVSDFLVFVASLGHRPSVYLSILTAPLGTTHLSCVRCMLWVMVAEFVRGSAARLCAAHEDVVQGHVDWGGARVSFWFWFLGNGLGQGEGGILSLTK